MNRLSADLWDQWHTIYLQTLQQRKKWQSRKANLNKGDLVLLKEENCGHRVWPLARVHEVHPGAGGLVSVATVFCNGKTYKRTVGKLVPVLRVSDGASLSRECVQACKDT